MVKLEWGTKRTCLNCEARFYDMLKKPPTCPKCETVFETLTATRGRRSKNSVANVAKDILALDVVGADIDLDLVADIDSDLIEDTDELDESLNDIPDVLSGEEDI